MFRVPDSGGNRATQYLFLLLFGGGGGAPFRPSGRIRFAAAFAGRQVAADKPADAVRKRLVAQRPGGAQCASGHVRIVAAARSAARRKRCQRTRAVLVGGDVGFAGGCAAGQAKRRAVRLIRPIRPIRPIRAARGGGRVFRLRRIGCRRGDGRPLRFAPGRAGGSVHEYDLPACGRQAGHDDDHDHERERKPGARCPVFPSAVCRAWQAPDRHSPRALRRAWAGQACSAFFAAASRGAARC